MSLRILTRSLAPIAARQLYRTAVTASFVSTRTQLNSFRFQSNISKASKVSEEVSQKLSSGEQVAKIYDYKDIKELIANPNPNKILVDVREPEEFKEIAIPTSINIPYKSTPGALDLSPEEFEDVFKFEKPSKDKELIFYCVAGVRSTAAADLAKIFGYKKLGNYVGSLEDWLEHEQPAAPEAEPLEAGSKTPETEASEKAEKKD